MPINPTSTKSKQYQALGIDEIANDIETVFNAVNDLETSVSDLETEVGNLPASPTTTVVNISSAQILAMHTTPVQLLPSLSANQYYDIEKMIIEYLAGNTPYTCAGNVFLILNSNNVAFVDNGIIQMASNTAVFVDLFNKGINSFLGTDYVFNNGEYDPEGAVYINSQQNTLGDGTMRAIITYTVRTFGA